MKTEPAEVVTAPKPAKAAAFLEERVLEVTQWNDKLFSFKTTRDSGFRFVNGQFAMIGLNVDGRPLLRAYSMASANYEENLEFYSIKVPDGPLTSRLQHIKAGDTLLVGRKPTGTLIQPNLLPGKHLYLLSTGTGLAPFASIIKDPEIYDLYEKIILVHGCRNVDELAYGDLIVDALMNHEFLGEYAREKLIYYPTATREAFKNKGRVTDLIESGKLEADIGLPKINSADDRVMLCGSPALLADMRVILEKRGFEEGNMTIPGSFVIERAFVDK